MVIVFWYNKLLPLTWNIIRVGDFLHNRVPDKKGVSGQKPKKIVSLT